MTVLATGWIALGLACCALAVSLRAAVLAARSAPSALLAEVKDLAEVVRRVESDAERWSGKVTAWRTELEGLAEAVENMLDSVETKRRRIAATESKAAKREQQQQADPSSDLIALANRARQQGLM